MTVLAGMGDDLAGPMAFGTAPDIDHLAKERILGNPDLPCTMAVRTGFRRAAGGCPGTMTGFTFLFPVHGHLLLRTKGRFLKGDLGIHPQVSPLPGAIVGPAAGAPSGTSKEHIEDVVHAFSAAETAKALEPAAEGVAGTRAGPSAVLESGMAVLVIGRSLLGIAEDTVGFIGLFEFIRCFRIVFVQVRVILPGQFVVGLFQFIGCGVFGNAQHLIVVSLLCHPYLPLGKLISCRRQRLPHPLRRRRLSCFRSLHWHQRWHWHRQHPGQRPDSACTVQRSVHTEVSAGLRYRL